MKKYLALISVILISCSEVKTDTATVKVCNCAEREKVEKMVEKAQDKKEAYEIAIKTYCHREQVYIKKHYDALGCTHKRIDWTLTKLDSCETIVYSEWDRQY